MTKHFISELKKAETPALASFRKQVCELAEVETANSTGGSRNELLNKASFAGGILVATGEAEEYFVVNELEKACETNNYEADYGEAEVTRIIDAGMAAGIEAANVPEPEREHSDNPIFDMIITAEDLSKLPPMSWLLDDLIVENSIAVLAGDSNIGKSFMAVDIAAHIATGMKEWHGRELSLSGPVVYLAAEGRAGLNNRRAAWEKVYGVSMGTDFKILPHAVDADSREWEQLIEYVSVVKPVLTVVDTMSQTLGNIDENNEPHKYVRQCDKLRVASGGAVLIVHHVNKGGGYRGGTAIKSNVDTMMMMYKDSGDPNITLHLLKQKDGQTGDVADYKLKQIVIGKKDNGDPRTSAVWVPARGSLPWSPTDLKTEDKTE